MTLNNASPTDIHSVDFLETCNTSLTIHNIPVRLVGVVLALLEDAGLAVEINVAKKEGPREG